MNKEQFDHGFVNPDYKECDGDYAFYSDVNGNLWGIASYDRLNSAKWHQRLWAKVSKRYKRKFMDLKGIPIEKHKNK